MLRGCSNKKSCVPSLLCLLVAVFLVWKREDGLGAAENDRSAATETGREMNPLRSARIEPNRIIWRTFATWWSHKTAKMTAHNRTGEILLTPDRGSFSSLSRHAVLQEHEEKSSVLIHDQNIVHGLDDDDDETTTTPRSPPNRCVLAALDGSSQYTRGRRLSPFFLAAFYDAVRRSEFARRRRKSPSAHHGCSGCCCCCV